MNVLLEVEFYICIIYNKRQEKAVIIMEDNFNVENPTKENIEHAIKNLLFCVTAAASMDEYKECKELCNNALTKINKVLPIYFNTGSLKNIEIDDLQEIMYDLIDLEVEAQDKKAYYYGEWSLLWIETIIRLRLYEIKLGGTSNGER